MANLFVLYIPVEEVEEEEPEEGLKKSSVSQPLKETASSAEVAKLTKSEPKQNSERDEIDSEAPAETHPLLGTGEVVGRFVKSQSSHSINKVQKKDSQPLGTENYKEVAGSRFKVSEVSSGAEGGSGEGLTMKEVNDKMENDELVSQEVMTLREFLEDKLVGKLNVSNYVWQKTSDEAHWMVTFMVSKDRCDHIYNFLTSLGLGWIPGTSVSVFATSVHKEGVDDHNKPDISTKSKKFNAEKTEFIKSIKSSLTVAQVVGDIGNNAKLTFDFLLLIFLASVIAGLGLAENSSVVLVASMLISPLMGPIIGFTFGMVVKNTQLCLLSFRTELIGLFICLVYGFVFGVVTASIEGSSVDYSADSVWPTSEMASRGMLRSLWVGVLIALPSGAGVALAILGGNTGSLVGVAISASLLPPVVNAGMLWGLAVVTSINPPELVSSMNPVFNNIISNTTNTTTTITTTTTPSPSSFHPPNCPAMKYNHYKATYSCTMWQEAFVMASLSLLLAILNILCIFLMGTLVMKIKEISPLPGATKQSASFWKKDLDFYRHAYETVKGYKSTDMGNMAKAITSMIRANPKADVKEVISSVKDDQFFRSLSDPNTLLDSLMKMKDAEKTHPTLPVEFKYHDNVYHTVAGQMAKIEPVSVSNVFETPVRQSLATPTSPLTPMTLSTPLKAGGCVLRLRRSQSKVRPARHTAQVLVGGQADIGDMLKVKFSPSVEEKEEEEEEEEEEERLMVDLDWLAKHQRKSKTHDKSCISTAV